MIHFNNISIDLKIKGENNSKKRKKSFILVEF